MANPLAHPQLHQRGRPGVRNPEPRRTSVPLALSGVAAGAAAALALSREEVSLLLALRGNERLMPSDWWWYHVIGLLLLLASSVAASALAVSSLHFARHAVLRRTLVGVALLAALVVAPMPAYSFGSLRVPTGWVFSLPSAYRWGPLAAAVVACIIYTLGLAVLQRRAASRVTP